MGIKINKNFIWSSSTINQVIYIYFLIWNFIKLLIHRNSTRSRLFVLLLFAQGRRLELRFEINHDEGRAVWWQAQGESLWSGSYKFTFYQFFCHRGTSDTEGAAINFTSGSHAEIARRISALWTWNYQLLPSFDNCQPFFFETCR